MTVKEAGLTIAGGTIAGIIAVAFFLILGSKQPIPTIPFYKECQADGECISEDLECADCMVCHTVLKRCTYGMKNTVDCPCVEKEKYPCEYSPGVPGVRVCEERANDRTRWGDCLKL
jgi:hypothetical protein